MIQPPLFKGDIRGIDVVLRRGEPVVYYQFRIHGGAFSRKRRNVSTENSRTAIYGPNALLNEYCSKGLELAPATQFAARWVEGQTTDRRALLEQAKNKPEEKGVEPKLVFVPCPLCGNDHSTALWTLPDRLHGIPGEFSYVKCSGCGLVRQNPRTAEDSISGYYPDDYLVHSTTRPPVAGRGRTHAIRRQWLEWLLAPRRRDIKQALSRFKARLFGLTRMARFNPLAFPGNGKRLLDIGCASGDFLAEMQALDWRVEGVEMDEKAAETARGRGLNALTGAFPESANRIEGPFDAIFMRQFIEHSPDPVGSLRSARSLLSESGVLVLTTPLIDGLLARMVGPYWYHLDPPRHMVLFARAQLRKACRSAGLRPIALLDFSSTDSWTRSLDYRFGQKGQGAGLDRSRLFHFLLRPLVRLADLARWGDNGVVIAVKSASTRDDAPRPLKNAISE